MENDLISQDFDLTKQLKYSILEHNKHESIIYGISLKNRCGIVRYSDINFTNRISNCIYDSSITAFTIFNKVENELFTGILDIFTICRNLNANIRTFINSSRNKRNNLQKA